VRGTRILGIGTVSIVMVLETIRYCVEICAAKVERYQVVLGVKRIRSDAMKSTGEGSREMRERLQDVHAADDERVEECKECHLEL